MWAQGARLGWDNSRAGVFSRVVGQRRSCWLDLFVNISPAWFAQCAAWFAAARAAETEMERDCVQIGPVSISLWMRFAFFGRRAKMSEGMTSSMRCRLQTLKCRPA